MELSIVTCTIPERQKLLSRVARQILSQSRGLSVEHIIVPGDGTVGQKISRGLSLAKGRYVCVVDDDDKISDDYISSILNELEHDPDVVTFGMRTPGQSAHWLLAHSEIDGAVMPDGDVIKVANHLCVWRREMAVTAPCVPRNYGWDVIWYWALRHAYPKARERHVHRVLYHYLFSPENTRAQSRESIADSQDNIGARIRIYRHTDGRLLAGPNRKRLWGADCVRIEEIPDVADLTLLKEVVFT